MRERRVELGRPTKVRESLIGPVGRTQGFAQVGMEAGGKRAEGGPPAEKLRGLRGSPLLKDKDAQTFECQSSFGLVAALRDKAPPPRPRGPAPEVTLRGAPYRRPPSPTPLTTDNRPVTSPTNGKTSPENRCTIDSA